MIARRLPFVLVRRQLHRIGRHNADGYCSLSLSPYFSLSLSGSMSSYVSIRPRLFVGPETGVVGIKKWSKTRQSKRISPRTRDACHPHKFFSEAFLFFFFVCLIIFFEPSPDLTGSYPFRLFFVH